MQLQPYIMQTNNLCKADLLCDYAILTSSVVLVLIGGLDSADFGDRSTKERDFGIGEDGFGTGDDSFNAGEDGFCTVEDSFGTGEDGFCTGEGKPVSDLVVPFLVTLLSLEVADVFLPSEAFDKPDLLKIEQKNVLEQLLLEICQSTKKRCSEEDENPSTATIGNRQEQSA
ncbi:hypothetical protein Cni_G22539 [Canna indica]|uniref:Uncharacterized protein n=1 Tax=Canna indica TaxID=4628 RepID=A0AAQ3KST3_9LILI|nr:hypothetical protein Cni_G22539 [Canna indica]